mmetsp:Transcript_79937/g.258936  ORF Transcript_79937/g.258936 Transcript_79937/m.258936 type:complete len:144 (+) Transcript_79937:602-1033(+)
MQMAPPKQARSISPSATSSSRSVDGEKPKTASTMLTAAGLLARSFGSAVAGASACQTGGGGAGAALPRGPVAVWLRQMARQRASGGEEAEEASASEAGSTPGEPPQPPPAAERPCSALARSLSSDSLLGELSGGASGGEEARG